MRNDQNLRIITFPCFGTPSTPPDVAKWGLQTFYHYCPSSPMLEGLLMVLLAVCNTSRGPPFTLY